jgi:hypothetical protein
MNVKKASINKKQSAIKNYGEIANELLNNNQLRGNINQNNIKNSD